MKKIPNHVAVIPDGNRRWARSKGFKPWLGHTYSIKNTKLIFEEALKMGIPCFSFWASSQDNLAKRTKAEVTLLLNSFKKEFAQLAIDEKVHKKQVRINILGDWRRQFPAEVKKPMEKAIEMTKKYNKFNFNFLIAYSGIEESISALKTISKQGINHITPQIIKNYLYTKDLPNVDYLIRTGGEPHMSSGFMMWDIADAQMYFSDKLWPEFSTNDFREAIKEYERRSRRFGK